jgi:hypothetical protein
MLRSATFLALVLASQACSSSDQSLEPIRIIRGDPSQGTWFDVTITGFELDEHDGRLATSRIGFPDRPPERLGSGEARISGGTFTLSFPMVQEPHIYKRKVLLIEIDGDGLCDPKKDLVFEDSSFTTKPLSLAATVNSSITLPPSTRLMHRSSEDSDCEPFLAPWPTE